jgi:hypothetical protein
MSAFAWASPAAGKQSNANISPAQRISRPQFSRVTVRAFWTETFAVVYNAIEPFIGTAAARMRTLGSLRLRLLLPRLSYGAAAAALLLGCLQHAASRNQVVMSRSDIRYHCLCIGDAVGRWQQMSWLAIREDMARQWSCVTTQCSPNKRFEDGSQLP